MSLSSGLTSSFFRALLDFVTDVKAEALRLFGSELRGDQEDRGDADTDKLINT